MDTVDTVQRRPGGRSAAVRGAVLEAALDALASGGAAPSIPELAARAGVAASSIYRRWGSWEAIVSDALLAGSDAAVPVPDTGSLREDLLAYTRSIARYLESPRGHALARAAAMQGDAADGSVRERFWRLRFRSEEHTSELQSH